MFVIIVFFVDLVFDITGGPIFGRLMTQLGKLGTKQFWVALGQRVAVFFKSITQKQALNFARLVAKHNIIAKIKRLVSFFILTQLLSYEPFKIWVDQKKAYLIKKKDQAMAMYKKHPTWFKAAIFIILILVVLSFSLYSLALFFVPIPGKKFFLPIGGLFKKLASKMGILKFTDMIFGAMIPAKARKKIADIKETSTKKVVDLKLVEKGAKKIQKIQKNKKKKMIFATQNRSLPPEYYQNLNKDWLKNTAYVMMIIFVHVNLMIILITSFH